MQKTAPAERVIFGHPAGVTFLAFTETWERFSFYGMRALLVLYLVQQLLLPGHIENVAGMAGFRAAVEALTGPLSTQAFASQVFGLYTGLVYLTPILGGVIADRWLGAKTTVLLGIALMAAGHLLMAIEATTLLALLLLILGSGCLKGNIAAQVGHLYPPGEEARRATGYTLFSTGINIGGTVGPLVCGVVAQVWGWHMGFAVAGIGMLLAAAIYLAGLRHFAAEKPRKQGGANAASLTRPERKMVAMMFVVLLLGMSQAFASDVLFNSGFIFLAERVDLTTFVGTVPEAWFVSEDALASVLIVPVLIGLWRWQEKRGKPSSELDKIALGGVIMALSALCFAIGDFVAGSGRVTIFWPVTAFALSGISFMFTWPTTLSLISRRSPLKVASLMLALVYFTNFLSGVFSGWVGRFYEIMLPWQFWIGTAALSFSSAVLIWLFGSAVTRRMDRLGDQIAGPSAQGLYL